MDNESDLLGRYLRGEDIENGVALYKQYLEKIYIEDIAPIFDENIEKKLNFFTPITDEFIYKQEQLEKIAQFKRKSMNALIEKSLWVYEGPDWRDRPGGMIKLPVTRGGIWEQRLWGDPFAAITGYYADSWWEEDFDRNSHPPPDVFMPSLLADPRCPRHLRESPELLRVFTPRPAVKFFCDPTFNFDAPHRMIAICCQSRRQAPSRSTRPTNGRSGTAGP
jgi:hypothetical protein